MKGKVPNLVVEIAAESTWRWGRRKAGHLRRDERCRILAVRSHGPVVHAGDGGGATDVRFGLAPTDDGSQAARFQPQESLEGHADVILLGFRFARLGFFHAAALFDAAMVNLDSPGFPIVAP